MGEKTEKATPKKLRDARKKGQIAKSQDFPSAFTFMVSISITLSLAGQTMENFSVFFETCFKAMGQASASTVLSLIHEALRVILVTSLPILMATVTMGVLVNFLIVGPLFTFEVFKPDIKKFDVIQNIKGKFKMKTLFELLKSMFKITGAAVIIYLTVKDKIPEVSVTAKVPVIVSVQVARDFLTEVVFKVGLFFLTVAIIDLVYQKYNFAKEMKMEKFEIKQEYKDSEGNPEIKGKRKEIAREIAYDSSPSQTKKAKAVITNPTHIAVGIDYEPKISPTPYIVVMGKGHIAKRIMEEAANNNVPIMRNVALARALYYKGDVNQMVPEETFEAVADVILWVRRLKRNKESS